MKKLNYLFIVLALVLTACSSDDDSNPPGDTSGDLIGTWIGQDVDYTGSSSTTVQGQSFDATFVGEAYDVDYTLTFTENPNEIISDGSYSIELTTTALGQTQVDNVENLEFLNSGTWTQSGNMLTVISEGNESEATILQLTDTMLVLELIDSQTVVQEGIEVSSTINATVTYTRM
jgi:hypothetical protein